MQPQRELAIVLRSIPYQERHRVVTALTENRGVVSALARNCIQSRRFGGTLDLFSASEWLFTEKPGAELWSLNEAQIRRSFEGLRSDFEKLSLASALSEVALRAGAHIANASELFKLHSNALVAIEESLAAGAGLRILNSYFAKLLQWSGYQPQLQACLGCAKTLESLNPRESVTCLISEGGWICETCRSERTRHVQGDAQLIQRTSAAVVGLFHLLVEVPIRKASQVELNVNISLNDMHALFKFLEGLVIYHIPGFDKQPIKALRFLNLESSLSPRGLSLR